ncbi:MAG: hypothetical protein R3Y06_02110 [Faecalibacterium sp.]
MEWIFPLIDYHLTLKKNERFYEVTLPCFVGVISVFIYCVNGLVALALDKLSTLLPTAISILIGFTAMLITILLTSSGDNVSKLKDTKTDVKLRGKIISLYQRLHIQLIHVLFNEIILLLCIFLYLFISGLDKYDVFNIGILYISVYLILNILLSILRGITNIYFSFYSQKE